MTKYIAALFVFCLGFSVFAYRVEDEAVADYEVRSHIAWFLQNRSVKIQQRALMYSTSVVHWSKEYKIDPLLTSTIISMESSYLAHSIGAIGEAGLMQVHWKGCRKGFDLTKPDDQIHAGVKCLARCFKACDGQLDRALTKYATGHCRGNFRGLKHRLKRYRKNLRLHRKPEPVEMIEKLDRMISRTK